MYVERWRDEDMLYFQGTAKCILYALAGARALTW